MTIIHFAHPPVNGKDVAQGKFLCKIPFNNTNSLGYYLNHGFELISRYGYENCRPCMVEVRKLRFKELHRVHNR